MNPLIYRRKTARLLVLCIILSAAALFALSCKKHSEAPAEKYTWTTYPVTDNFVWAISFDAQGNKWFGTNGFGISEFDGAHWTTYDTTNSGLVDNNIFDRNALVFDAQGLWIGTLRGLSEFDGTHWTSYKSAVNGLYNGSSGMFNSDVLAIAIDSQTNFWIGGAGLSELQIQK